MGIDLHCVGGYGLMVECLMSLNTFAETARGRIGSQLEIVVLVLDLDAVIAARYG